MENGIILSKLGYKAEDSCKLLTVTTTPSDVMLYAQVPLLMDQMAHGWAPVRLQYDNIEYDEVKLYTS